MLDTLHNIPFLILISVVLFSALFLLRCVFKFAWKFIRVALILLSLLLIAGYLLGYLDIVIHQFPF